MDAVYGNEKRGQPPYDPLMMTKVLVYAYCVGVFSSRRIERRLVEDVAFRVLAAFLICSEDVIDHLLNCATTRQLYR